MTDYLNPRENRLIRAEDADPDQDDALDPRGPAVLRPRDNDLEAQARRVLTARGGALCFAFGKTLELEGGAVIMRDGTKAISLKDVDGETLERVRAALNSE